MISSRSNPRSHAIKGDDRTRTGVRARSTSYTYVWCGH